MFDEMVITNHFTNILHIFDVMQKYCDTRQLGIGTFDAQLSYNLFFLSGTTSISLVKSDL